MEILGLIVFGVIAWAVYSSAYASGKREGSRKGYGVGFDRGSRRKSSGCLIVVLAGLASILAATALAMF